MLIAICLKQVPTREWPVRVDSGGTRVREADAWELNEPDAYALEAALRLKERHGGEVIAISAGPLRVTQVLREALARGADRALHVHRDDLAHAEAPIVAEALAGALAAIRPDLVFAGLQSTDEGTGSVGIIVAERLRVPHASIVMAIEVVDGGVRVKRELEGGWFQWIRMPLPALLTIQSGIDQLRYATLRGIMAAKKKTIETAVPSPAPVSRVRVLSIAAPSRSRAIRLFPGLPAEAAAALVHALRETRAL
jgi:electron transfer flavoprotein beta subunit